MSAEPVDARLRWTEESLRREATARAAGILQHLGDSPIIPDDAFCPVNPSDLRPALARFLRNHAMANRLTLAEQILVFAESPATVEGRLFADLFTLAVGFDVTARE